MANKYRLKPGVGIHREGGRTYVAGSVIETDLDLGTMFPGKFKVLRGPTPKKKSELPAVDETEEEVRKPRAAVIGTRAESEESKSEDGEDDPGDESAEESDDDGSEEGGDDEEEAPKRAKVLKKKAKASTKNR